MKLLWTCSQKGNDKFIILYLLATLIWSLLNVCGNQNIMLNFINMYKYVSVNWNKIINSKEALEKKKDQCRVVDPSNNEITPSPKAQETLRGDKQNSCKGQGIRELAMRLYPKNVGSYRHKFAPTRLPKGEWAKDKSRLAKVDWGLPSSPNPPQRTTGKHGKVRVGETVFHRGKHTNSLSSTKWSCLKIYIHK